MADKSANRRLSLKAVAMTALALLAGCNALTFSDQDVAALKPSASPVTVDTVNRNNRLAKIGAEQHPRILATYGGEYRDPKLERAVAKVVGNLTTVSGNPNQTYRITILNSPNINAFALPGGYLYVTRGLLALANDSAELAAVIAHEMAHVVANHGIQRQQREAEAVIASRVVSEVLQDDTAGKEALIRGKLQMAQFSRNQELQADAIGVKMMGEAGYDPFAAARFLQSMAAYSDFRNVSGATDASLDFLASHPAAPQRIELARGHARRVGAPGVGTTDRDSYLNGIDGLLYGDTPEEGYVRGRKFTHPVLGVSFEVPAGFEIDNTADAVMATGPGEVAIRFDGAQVKSKPSMVDYMRGGWVTGLDEASVRATTSNGLPAAVARARADRWEFEIMVVDAGDRIYRFLTAAPVGSATLAPTAKAVADSFRIMSPAEKAALKPLRIRVVTAKPGETIGTLANRLSGTDRKLDLFRLLNAIPPGGSVSAGDKVKLISE